MIYVSYKAKNELLDWLRMQDDVTLVGPVKNVDPRIDGHADLLYCKLAGSMFIGDENILGNIYPSDCLFNAVMAGNYFIHNKKVTAPALLAAAKDSLAESKHNNWLNAAAHGEQIKYINVNQAYTKCNVAVIDDIHIITSDKGIAKALERTEIKVLLISPGQIELPGFNTGFIGGCCGRVNDCMVFNGDIAAHDNYEQIKGFVAECGLEIISFPWPLCDIGSIIQG